MSLEHILALRCVRCGVVQPRGAEGTCPACGLAGILDVEYDYALVARTLTPDSLAQRPRTLWRYAELLPIDATKVPPHLAVGCTPLYETPRLASVLGVERMFVKDDGRNPTGSFKDRASAIGVVKAREAGASVVACASTGNAASSLAGFSAAVGLPAVIFVPQRAPEAKIAQLLIFGARVLRVAASYDDVWQLCQDACARYGWYNRNCAVNPYLVEGKKTVGLELGEELGPRMPEWLAMSVGDGCTIAGAWKGLKEAHRLGWISRLPKLLGVQARGSSPLVEAWNQLRERERAPGAEADGFAGGWWGRGPSPEKVEGPSETIADSIAVGTPRNWRKALRAVRESGGAFIAVDDSEILEAMRTTARQAAVFGEPAGVAAVAGIASAVKAGVIARGEGVVTVITGNGLKDTKTALVAAGAPLDIPATNAAVDDAVHKLGVL